MRILITGAAGGLGRGLAVAFAGRGHDLVLVDIDRAALDQTALEAKVAGASCRCYVVDVSDRDRVQELADRVVSEIGGIDMLVNNAGVLVVGDFVDTPIEEWDWLMGVNFWGYVYMIKAFLPGMIERGLGHVVNVSSIGGLMGCPIETTYAASKFAISGMTEALYNELRDKGVKVTLVCPSSVATPILSTAHHFGYGEGYTQEIRRYWSMDQKKAIAEIVRGIEKGRFLVIAGKVGKIGYYSRRVSLSLYLETQRRIYRRNQRYRV